MRLHTNTLNTAQVHTAIREAGATAELVEWHRSRSHAGAFEVRLSGSGRTGGQWGNTDTKSATWDEWGMVLGALYALDPGMVVGSGTYLDADHFHWSTGYRFDVENPDRVTPTTQHKQHRWEPGGEAVTGSYHVHTCKGDGCTVLTRRVAHGRSWAEINAA